MDKSKKNKILVMGGVILLVVTGLVIYFTRNNKKAIAHRPS